MKKRDFDQLIGSLREAGAIRRGDSSAARVTEFEPPQIRAIRVRMELTQAEFARMIGVSIGTLRNWEQGRRRPDGSAMALLMVAIKSPQVVADALNPKKLQP